MIRTTITALCFLFVLGLPSHSHSDNKAIKAKAPNTVESNTHLKPGLNSEQQKELLKQLRLELMRVNEELSKYKDERYQYEINYTKKYYSYLAEKADVNIEQFKWQRSASERLLWLVVTIVLSGVVFSGIQLWRAANIKDLGGKSTVEIEARKIKITTSVVGVIVLAISIIFFYFFLIEVYRIKIVDMTPVEVKPAVVSEKPVE